MTELGPLPEEWEVVRLGEVAEYMRAGGTPSRKEPRYWGGGIPFVLIEDMTSCGLYLHSTKETISQEGLENSSAWLVPPGSLLLSMYATIGESAYGFSSAALLSAKPVF
ncbi:MAG: restriction endonuclease subunit S, partial [Bacillota bacterium]